MKHFTTEWRAGDGLRLFAQGWEPENGLQAVVCLVHGLGEQSSRYSHLAKFLTQAGYGLLTFDLRGHGKSGGPRGHVDSFENFMDDIDCLLEDAANRYNGKPRFLYGHSLGGILVLNFALRRKPYLAGVIATGPGLRTALEQQKIKILSARILGTVFPTLAMPTGLEAKMISRDPEVVQAYMNDPLVHDRATLGMAKNTLSSIQWAFEHASEFSVPLLIMHGSADQIAFQRGSQEFASLVKGDCELKLWDGLYHEIHNEPEQAQVFEFLLEWLEKKRKAWNGK